MKFSLEKAEALIKKWGLADTTIRIWRHRGEIPDEYDDPEFRPRKVATPSQQARVMEILSLPELNIARMWSVTNAQVRDWRKEEYRMSQEKNIKIKTEITQLRNLLRRYTKHPSQENLAPILKDRRIKSATLLASELKMYERLRKGLDAYEEELERTKIIISSLYNRMKI